MEGHELRPLGTARVVGRSPTVTPSRGGSSPTIVRGAPKPVAVLAPPSRRQADLGRPEMVMLREIVPTLEPNVLLEILRGNEWDLDRSTDAALALFASLSAEEGTAVLGNRQTAAADVGGDEAEESKQQPQQLPHAGQALYHPTPEHPITPIEDSPAL